MHVLILFVFTQGPFPFSQAIGGKEGSIHANNVEELDSLQSAQGILGRVDAIDAIEQHQKCMRLVVVFFKFDQ